MTDMTWLENFIAVYNKLGNLDLSGLETIYHPQVTFIDPMHRVEGYDELLAYFEKLFDQITSCDFDVYHRIENADEAAIYWNMTLNFKQLKSGQPITVEGHSLLKAKDGKVIFHRDYFDLGALLYEHVPVLGWIVKTVRQRVASQG